MPLKVTAHAAGTDLSKLIEAALAGEEVIIARGDKPVVRLVPVPPRPFAFGGLEGQLPAGGMTLVSADVVFDQFPGQVRRVW